MKKLYTCVLSILLALQAYSQIDVIKDRDTTRYESVLVYKESNPIKSGYWIFYDMKGGKSKEGLYRNDSLVGVWKAYYGSGALKSEITYVSNRPKGYAKFNYENGNVSEEGTWIDKKWVGDYRYFFENGTWLEKISD